MAQPKIPTVDSEFMITFTISLSLDTLLDTHSLTYKTSVVSFLWHWSRLLWLVKLVALVFPQRLHSLAIALWTFIILIPPDSKYLNGSLPCTLAVWIPTLLTWFLASLLLSIILQQSLLLCLSKIKTKKSRVGAAYKLKPHHLSWPIYLVQNSNILCTPELWHSDNSDQN